MTIAVFGYRNRITRATLIPSSQIAGLEATQLQNDQGAAETAWQSTGTSAFLTIDTGSIGSTWRAFGLFRTNLTSAATVRWRVSNDSTFSSGAVYDSGGATPAGVVPFIGQTVSVASSEVVGRYCLLEVSDPGNPDGYLNLPLAYAGPVWTPLTNIGWESTIGRDDTTDEVVSRGGQEFPAMRFVRRRWDVQFNGVRLAEAWAQAFDFDRVARPGTNTLFVPNPVSLTRNSEAIFGRMKPLSDIGFPLGSGDRLGWKIRMTERL